MRKSKRDRKRVSLYELLARFATETDAMRHIESLRWKNGRICPRCGSNETRHASHKTMPYWCRPCRKYFSVKTGTLMEGSNIAYRKWMTGIHLLSTSLKGVSSYKLANDIGMHQSNAWFMAHRIRTAWANNASELFGCQAEVDETCLGGKEKNRHQDKKLSAGRGAAGKTAAVGVKERDSRQIKSFKAADTKAVTPHRIVCDNVCQGATVRTDDATAYEGLQQHGCGHETVKHSAGEHVKGQAHANGTESFWSCPKRGYCGAYHEMSPRHLQKHVDEFSARQNVREPDAMVQIDAAVCGLFGKRLKCADLIDGMDGTIH